MRYQNGKIYILRNYVNEYIYIGSTTQPLYKRLSLHKKDLKVLRTTTYVDMKNLGISPSDLFIELICDFPCENVYRLRQKEGQIIKDFKNSHGELCLNQRISGRGYDEYYEENKGKISENQKE